MSRPTSARTPLPEGLAAPARRALAGAGYAHLEQLAQVSESTLGELHGIGPNALKTLRAALAERGLAFAGEKAAGKSRGRTRR